MKTTLKTLSSWMLIVAISLLAIQATYAKEVNQRRHLAPEVRVKVGKVLAKRHVYKYKKDTNPAEYINYEGRGNQIIGDFSYVRNAPREVIIVADDIINVNTR